MLRSPHRHRPQYISMKALLFLVFLAVQGHGFPEIRISRCSSTLTQQSRLFYAEFDEIRLKLAPPLNSGAKSKSKLSMQGWEGDDLRWITRWRRRLRRRSIDADNTPAKSSMMGLQVLFFLYQVATTVNFIRRGHPDYWPSHAITMICDAFMGTSVRGPLMLDFAYSNSLAHNQPHRFLTSGFLHGSLLHLLVNLDTMRRQPSWLETGLGAPLYWTTFLVSVVGGNLAHSFGINDPFDRTLVLGASGGICGLYGLTYGSLVRMGNGRAASRIARGMVTMILSGFFVESISSMSHIGGFLCGVAVAIFFAPSYRKDYSMRRKNSAEYDPTPRDFRQAMGFGVMPTQRGILPLSLLWLVAGFLLVATRPEFRQIPALVAKGLLFPGTLIS